jgi:GNAT superfamily N-acetyltransferase
MANAKIDVLGPNDLELVARLYNQVFHPARDGAFFKRRFLARYNSLILVATVEAEPVGFALGMELKPTVFYSWLLGVLPHYRRTGIGAQLTDAMSAWAHDHGYESIRLECQNRHRAMLHMVIERKFDIVGIRWDADRGENLIIFEKVLSE